MKVIQVVPRADAGIKLKAALKDTERRLRGSKTTFSRAGGDSWKHVRYAGRITFEESKGGILIVEVRTRKADGEWQLLQAFVGYLDRHLSEYIESITIFYR
jgi:hypothetical protein